MIFSLTLLSHIQAYQEKRVERPPPNVFYASQEFLVVSRCFQGTLYTNPPLLELFSINRFILKPKMYFISLSKEVPDPSSYIFS